MWGRVKAYAERYDLLDDKGLYVVALSGGADSVALLVLLRENGFRVHAAHCNFHLRGEESERDETFCEQLCRQYNVPFHRVHFATHDYAEAHKVSIEMAARELRYRWFEQLRQDLGADGICVAHHRDDNVETVLLNLIRGTGLRGLTGMKPRNGHVLRPLLCVSRQDIESYLSEKGQPYVTDSTNLQPDVLRNKIRLQLLPLLQSLNPDIQQGLSSTAEHLTGAQAVLDRVVERMRGSRILKISELSSYGSSEYLLYEWAKNYGFNGSQVRQVLTAETGHQFSSPQGYDLLVDRGYVRVEESLKPLAPLVMPETGCYVLADGSKMALREVAAYVSRERYRATADADKLRFPLTVRRVQTGDRMVPYGMKGQKLLSDLMTDMKMNVFEKRHQLVVTDASGTVVWLVGLRLDDRVAVTPATQRVVELTFMSRKHK